MTRQQSWSEKWAQKWPDTPVVGAVMGDYADPAGDNIVSVTHPRHPGWVFRLTFSPSGSMVGFGVCASAANPEGPSLAGFMNVSRGHDEAVPPVTSRFLRTLPVGEIEATARRYHLDQLEDQRTWLSAGLVDRFARSFGERPRPGRSGRDDRAYAEVAAMYVQKCASSKTPLKDLAGELNYSPSQVRSILNAARSKRRGLLTRSEPGKPGGELTEKALELLRHDEGGK